MLGMDNETRQDSAACVSLPSIKLSKSAKSYKQLFTA